MSNQGWTNYETWVIAVAIDNDEELLERFGFYGSYHDLNKLARVIQEYFEEAKPDLGSTVYADLLSAAISEVNWYELAKSYSSEEEESNEKDE